MLGGCPGIGMYRHFVRAIQYLMFAIRKQRMTI